MPFSDPAAILVSPSSTTVNESATVQLTCEVEGKPKPTVTWFKDGVEVNTSVPEISSTHPGSDGRSVSTLTIQKGVRSDQGSYHCGASNGIGASVDSSSAIVTVNCKYLLLSLVCWVGALWIGAVVWTAVAASERRRANAKLARCVEGGCAFVD